MGYSFWLPARVLLYAPYHRQDNTYHGFCYTSREALAGTRNRSLGPLHEGSIRRPIAPWANALTTELHFAPCLQVLYLYLRYLHSPCSWMSFESRKRTPNDECRRTSPAILFIQGASSVPMLLPMRLSTLPSTPFICSAVTADSFVLLHTKQS